LQLSAFGGSAWEYRDERQQYYLHSFLKEQPDFNYRSDNVKEEIKVSYPKQEAANICGAVEHSCTRYTHASFSFLIATE
jgi:glycosidase